MARCAVHQSATESREKVTFALFKARVSRTQHRNKSSGMSLPLRSLVVASRPRPDRLPDVVPPAAGLCAVLHMHARKKAFFCLHERKQARASRSRASERERDTACWDFCARSGFRRLCLFACVACYVLLAAAHFCRGVASVGSGSGTAVRLGLGDSCASRREESLVTVQPRGLD